MSDTAAAAAEGDNHGMGHRTYRLEKPNAVTSGKWYFEMEVLTSGPMRIGWVEVSSQPGKELGSDDKSWAFDGFRVSINLFLSGVSLFSSTGSLTLWTIDLKVLGFFHQT